MIRQSSSNWYRPHQSARMVTGWRRSCAIIPTLRWYRRLRSVLSVGLMLFAEMSFEAAMARMIPFYPA